MDENIGFFENLLREEVTYISLGSLTNLAFLLEVIPPITASTRLLIMGRSINTDYEGRRRAVPTYNIVSDVKAAQKVFSSRAKITMIGLDVTWNLVFTPGEISMIKMVKNDLNSGLISLLNLWQKHNPRKEPILHDVLTLAVLVDSSLVTFVHLKKLRFRWKKMAS